MYHRYVEFKGFVGGMFQGSGFRGKLLNKALHHQHERIYNFNPQTKYGVLEGPGREMTLKFLEMVYYDQGGRIFTYVITLDGMFRFTETGKEFGIDLLSKHTMHSDVNVSGQKPCIADGRYTSLGAESSWYDAWLTPTSRRRILINAPTPPRMSQAGRQTRRRQRTLASMSLSLTTTAGHIDPTSSSYRCCASFWSATWSGCRF
jgi:hypothetical protein